MQTTPEVALLYEALQGSDGAFWRPHDTPCPRRGEYRGNTEVSSLEAHGSLLEEVPQPPPCSKAYAALPPLRRCRGHSPSFAPPRREHRLRAYDIGINTGGGIFMTNRGAT